MTVSNLSKTPQYIAVPVEFFPRILNNEQDIFKKVFLHFVFKRMKGDSPENYTSFKAKYCHLTNELGLNEVLPQTDQESCEIAKELYYEIELKNKGKKDLYADLKTDTFKIYCSQVNKTIYLRTLVMHLAIKSIMQKSIYKKIYDKQIISRMAGFRKNVPVELIPDLVKVETTERKIRASKDTLKKKWGLAIIKSRGAWFSYNLNKEQLHSKVEELKSQKKSLQKCH